MNIIFMGTPDFAVPSLQALYESQHTIAAVVTVPDKKKGRGQQICCSDVKKKAVELDLPVLQPEKLKDEQFLEEVRRLKPDIFVVVAYRILPYELYSIPKYGAINAHASLLPKYRGAAPIHWAVFNGEKETGVTVFQIDKKVDTGNIILQKKILLSAPDTTSKIYDELKELAPQALIEAVDVLGSGHLLPLSQNSALATPAPKVTSDTGKLDFSLSGSTLIRTLRAFSDWPGAWFTLNGKRIKVHDAKYILQENTEPGRTEILSKHEFAIHCRDGLFIPTVLQSPCKCRMAVEDWLNGQKINCDEKIDQ